jgi:two-component sensor histidine kinase
MDLRRRDPAAASRPDFGAVFEASPSPMLLMAADAPRYTMVAVNRAHAAAFRTTPDALEGRGLFEVFPDPPDPVTAVFLDTIRRSLERVMAGGEPDEMPVQPYAVVGADGAPEERFWGAAQTPVFGPAGRLTHILSSVRDVTAEVKERQATEARALLMREVDHRARNALTVVQSIVRLTEAETVPAFKSVVQGRVEALARAQTSLARRKWEGAHLRDVIEAELAALAFPGAWQVSGPPTLLPPEQVQSMSMVLHELATNAAKYGALSPPIGQLLVRWYVDGDDLVLQWMESGVLNLTGPPTEEGFGSRLVRLTVERQLNGTIAQAWGLDGLAVRLRVPLASLSGETNGSDG